MFYVLKSTLLKNLKNWRPIEFYDSILSLPNVKLIHPSVKNFDLLKNCKLVTLINATTGLEALFFKKTCNCIYRCFLRRSKYG